MTVGAIVCVLFVGVVILVRKPADARRVVRWSALAITVLVAAALTPTPWMTPGRRRAICSACPSWPRCCRFSHSESVG
ncbi:hypothetical protein NKG94_15290 [Micromonospora sp. M12]